MRFENALEAMRDGEEVGLEGSIDIDIEVFRIYNGEIQRMGSDGLFFDTTIRSEEILSNDWYVRRRG